MYSHKASPQNIITYKYTQCINIIHGDEIVVVLTLYKSIIQNKRNFSILTTLYKKHINILHKYVGKIYRNNLNKSCEII